MPEPDKFYDRLSGQVSIVTGAGSRGQEIGNGRAIALLFAREGAKVCVVTRDPENAQRTVEMIASFGGRAFASPGDVTKPIDCARVVELTLKTFGTLDILVNNVGHAFGGPTLTDVDDATRQAVMDVNFTSTFNMCRAAMPALIAGAGKAIVNISSIAGQRAHGSPLYGPAKAALDAFSRELAIIYGRQGIRANTISPGHLYTPHVAENPYTAALREVRRKAGPLGIEGDAWDVATAALFLASREARLLTGLLLPVDAGASQVAGLSAHQIIAGTD